MMTNMEETVETKTLEELMEEPVCPAAVSTAAHTTGPSTDHSHEPPAQASDEAPVCNLLTKSVINSYRVAENPL